MKAEETTKEAIEEKLNSGMGDFVKMEYLENCLKLSPPLEIRRFIFERLAEINEDKGMFAEAAKNMHNAADISITYKDKIRFFMKEVELLIKYGDFNKADEIFRNALALGNTQEKMEMRVALREFYKKQAEAYEKNMKRSNAVKIYEKLLSITEAPTMQREIKEKLLSLYEKLGKMQEYNSMKKQLE